MVVAGCIGLALAFLAPLPPERDGSMQPEAPKANGLLLGLIAAFLLLVTLMPLSLALAERWTENGFRADCRIAGGRVAHVFAGDARTYRCER